MKTLIVSLIAVGTLAVGPMQQAWAVDDEEPATVTIAGQTYTVVPDEEFRALGFDVPDVKPEANAAYDYIEALNNYVAPSLPQGDLRDKVLNGAWTEESGPLAEYMERNEDALEWIRAAAKKDMCHFPVLVPLGSSIEETSPAGILLSHLGPMRELSRFLVTEGKAYEFEARYADALDTYLLVLRLGDHAAQDPTLIAGLVGVACNGLGARAIEQCLVWNEIDKETLTRAQKRVAELAKGRPSVMVSMRGERAWSTSIVEYMIEHPRSARDLVEPDDTRSRAWKVAMAAMLASEEGRAQIRADVKAFWDAMDRAMAMPLPLFIKSGAGDEPVNKAKARKVPPNIMAMLGPAFSRLRSAYGRNDLCWTVLDIEFALARYAAVNGHYPASLDELKELMVSDGIDPFSASPLHYRLEDDGSYTIWSVGENLTDDNGAITAKCPDWKADDYVWNSAVIHGED